MIVIMRESTYRKRLEAIRQLGIAEGKAMRPQAPPIIKPLELKLSGEDTMFAIIAIGVNHLSHFLRLR